MDKKSLEIIFKDWFPLLSEFLQDKYFNKLINFLTKEYKTKTIYPAKTQVFNAFKYTSWKDLKVVILGQDPYYDGKANGLAFANNNDVLRVSPSLDQIRGSVEKSVYNTIILDFDVTLEHWAKQGVLLLNTALTVEERKPNSHKEPWDNFTKTIIKTINDNSTGIIFLLWGSNAKSYKNLIDENRHYVLEDVHPAYASRQYKDWNCKHFIEVNKLIEKNNGKEYIIKW